MEIKVKTRKYSKGRKEKCWKSKEIIKKVAWKRSGKISVTFENSPPRKFALKVFGMFLESHSGNAGMFMIPIFQACPQRPLNTLQIFPNSMIKKKNDFFYGPHKLFTFIYIWRRTSIPLCLDIYFFTVKLGILFVLRD